MLDVAALVRVIFVFFFNRTTYLQTIGCSISIWLTQYNLEDVPRFEIAMSFHKFGKYYILVSKDYNLQTKHHDIEWIAFSLGKYKAILNVYHIISA